MKIVFVYADSEKEWNCSKWNCIHNAEAINRLPPELGHSASLIYINDWVKNGEEVRKTCSEADIIVVERNYFGDTLTIMQFWKARNKTILAIFDDAYDIIHPQNISYDFWKYGKIKYKTPEGVDGEGFMLPRPLEQFKWALKIVKGIQVPSINLAVDWSAYNNTYYVHNYLDLEKYLNIKPLLPYEGLTIGWCGSMSHHSSFTDSGVLDALRKVSKRNPEIRILIGGDKRIYDMLESKNKLFQPYVPAEDWTALLKSIDIGLAPLSGEFDRRRSWVKVLEYMALQIPWIASEYPTYDELSEYGLMTKNGYVNWEKSINNMINEYPTYKKLAETKGYDFALKQTSDANIKRTLDLYQKLIETPYPIDIRDKIETVTPI